MNLQTMPDIQSVPSGRDVTAILGPTNTGKTHLAIERMVAHESGVIGLRRGAPALSAFRSRQSSCPGPARKG
jgi:hypothetical protein